MNLLKLPLKIFLVSCAFTPLFAQETYTDLYYNGDIINVSGWKRTINNAEFWNVGSSSGEVFTGDPTESQNYNWVFNGVVEEDQQGNITGYPAKNWTVHDVTVNYEVKAQCAFLRLVDSTRTMNITGDLNLSLNNSASWNETQSYISLQESGNALTIDGNWYINNKSAPATEGAKLCNQGILVSVGGGTAWNQSFLLKGDVIMSDNGNYTTNWGQSFFNSRITLRFNVADATVQGTINLVEGREGERVIDLLNTTNGTTATRSFGGINGTGAINIGATAAASTVDVTFTNSQAQTFSGSLAAGLADNTLNILMDASVSSASQTFKISESHKGQSANNIGIESLVVMNGKFELGAYAGFANGSLSLYGDNAVFAITSAVSNLDIGTVNFNSVSLTAGTMLFDLGDGESDVLNIAGAFNKTSTAGNLSMKFDGDTEIWDVIIADNGGYFDFDIITFDTTNLTASDFDIFTKNGYACELIFNEKSVTVRLTQQVPEASTAAALLGIAALAFAAHRRGGKSRQ